MGVGSWPFHNILLTLGVHCDNYTTLIMSVPRALGPQEQEEKVNGQLCDSIQVVSGSSRRESSSLLLYI